MTVLSHDTKFVFFGTDHFAVVILQTLQEQGLTPTLIVTSKDTPQGRKMTLTPPPVKVWAQNAGIPVIQPTNLRTIPTELTSNDYLFFLVASYGQIIPDQLITIPPMGILNIHPSLLPKYRGATPIETAILNGDQASGVTIMKIDSKMDHGEIICQETISIEDKNYRDLEVEMAKLGALLLSNCLSDYLSGKLTPKPQDHSLATYTAKLKKEDGLINLDDRPEINYRKFLAYINWPGIYFFTPDQRRIKITQAHFMAGQFIIDTVIPEGKKEISWELFKSNSK